MPAHEDWIAAGGLWPVTNDTAGIPIPDHVLGDADLSLMAKGLFALLLAHNGQPINPYDDAFEEPADVAAAIGELIDAGLVVRVER